MFKSLDEIVAMTKGGTYADLVEIIEAVLELVQVEDDQRIIDKLDAIDSEYGVY